MILSASATHALRAVAWLAADDGGGTTLGRELASKVDVPASYLSKVLATLARTGVLTASRGVRGGYRLARPAREITLMEIVEPFEGKRARPGCLLRPDQPCREDGHCPAHGGWSQVKETYLKFLESTTLADIRRIDANQAKRGRGRPRASRTHRGSSRTTRTRA
ncbi:MAG TPA: Rrf2 family transcriptional regulator [Anaeromyxobacteraceae bacterium]|nr:Rrf2 family transcriptional regulator [Anaeromyxobacteraceae bacterium]